MSRPKPLVLTDSEPMPQNAGGAQLPLTAYTHGSEAWQSLFGPAGGIPAPTEQTALQSSAIYACVSLLAGVIAALNLNPFDRASDGELTPRADDDLWWLLNEQMIPRWGADTGWDFVMQAKLLRGDGFLRILRDRNGNINGFEPLAWERVQPVPTRDGRRLVYAIAPDATIPDPIGGLDVVDQDDMLHFPGFGFNGVRGLSPLRHWLRMTGAVALTAQDYSARFFVNGARPDYVLGTEGALTPAAVDNVRTQIDERLNGPQGWHKPLLLTHGLKPHPLSVPPEDMALIGIRNLSTEDLCRVYHVPPFMVGHTDKVSAWGSGLEAMGKGFVRYALRRHLNGIQTEANRKIYRRATKVLAFDTSDLEAADFKTLIEGFRAALGRAGEDSIMTVEEIRERLRLNRSPRHGALGKGSGNAPQPAEPARP